jgi:hypothetical protein
MFVYAMGEMKKFKKIKIYILQKIEIHPKISRKLILLDILQKIKNIVLAFLEF